MAEGAEVFVGRDAELAVLEAEHARRGGSFVPVYGRRRVGKSELLVRFVRGKRAIFHVGKLAPAGLQLREFLREAALALDQPLLAQLAVTHWRDALEAVVDAHRGRGRGKLVLVFDEFQWTVGASAELPSVLQELWDRRWRRTGDVMLVLCGSFIGFMEREVLGAQSPLFGRRTAQIHLQPLSFLEAARLHPRWSLPARAEAYFVCGGIPLYLRALRPERSLTQNLVAELLNDFAPLAREPEFLLREELRDVENYHAVLVAVAAGAATAPDISRRTGLPERSLHYYIDQLCQLGYLARRHRLGDGPVVARHVRIALEDPLLRFWFRFVFPNRSAILHAGPAAAFARLIEPELPAYFGHGFERLCREALPRLYQAEGVTAPFTVGEYWEKDVQLDVVGRRADGVTDLGECKWGAVASVPALVAELEAKVARYPNQRGATLGRRFFVRHKTAAMTRQPGAWHDLRDLYALDPGPPAPRRRARARR